jgi:hypothetical protein
MTLISNIRRTPKRKTIAVPVIRLKNKQAGMEARGKAGFGRVPDTKPSHALGDFTGEYEHPAYGTLKIGMKDNQLQFDFHKIVLPLAHFHYDRFDSPNDEENGRASRATFFQSQPVEEYSERKNESRRTDTNTQRLKHRRKFCLVRKARLGEALGLG